MTVTVEPETEMLLHECAKRAGLDAAGRERSAKDYLADVQRRRTARQNVKQSQ